MLPATLLSTAARAEEGLQSVACGGRGSPREGGTHGVHGGGIALHPIPVGCSVATSMMHRRRPGPLATSRAVGRVAVCVPGKLDATRPGHCYTPTHLDRSPLIQCSCLPRLQSARRFRGRGQHRTGKPWRSLMDPVVVRDRQEGGGPAPPAGRWHPPRCCSLRFQRARVFLPLVPPVVDVQVAGCCL